MIVLSNVLLLHMDTAIVIELLSPIVKTWKRNIYVLTRNPMRLAVALLELFRAMQQKSI